MTATNQEVADLLRRMGTLLEIKGEVVFKHRAYDKAADHILALDEDLRAIKEAGRLTGIPGIGKTLAEKIAEYLDTGRLGAYERLIQEVPESIIEVIQVPSVGPKKAKLFWDRLKIKDVDGLEQAARKGRLLGLPGIQQKTVDNILQGIALRCATTERMNLGSALRLAEEIIAQLRPMPEIRLIEYAGSLRRMKETVGDIDLLVATIDGSERSAAAVMDRFVHLPMVQRIQAEGVTKSSVITVENVQVDLRVVDQDCFGAAWLYFTGSKGFNVRLRQTAKRKGLKVSEYGVFETNHQKETLLAGQTEQACFQALGLPYIVPEIREEHPDRDLFQPGFHPPKLITIDDIRGDLHTHSTWSDGIETIETMALAAKQRGYRYLAVTDHSQRLKVARGLNADRLQAKHDEIRALNAKWKDIHIFFGVEVEIDANGELDYTLEILKTFDIVIAAIHTGLTQTKEQLTRRLIKACEHPCVHIIAHPTGVHLGKRAPYEIDFARVCRAAAANHVCLEVNASCVRLDLDSEHIYEALAHGVTLAVNTDAHRTEHLDFMRLGVGIARRGWTPPDKVINTWSLETLKKFLRQKGAVT